jgi:hypothetical protein
VGVGRDGGYAHMATTHFYWQQAKLLLLLAAGDSDPVIKELLNRRAQEYLHMADKLYTESKLIVITPHAVCASSPTKAADSAI